MRIWTISMDGNAATDQQTGSIANALAKQNGNDIIITHFYPKAPGGKTLTDNTTTTWTKLLDQKEMAELSFNGPVFSSLLPDIIVSCRPETTALALSLKERSGDNTKIIHIQHPNGAKKSDGTRPYNFDLSKIDVMVLQPHEILDASEQNTGAQVLRTKLALHGITPQVLAQFTRAANPALAQFSDPVLSVMVGGQDDYIKKWTPDYFETLANDIKQVAGNYGSVFVITSRRTGAEGVEILRKAFAGVSNVHVDHPAISYKTGLAIGDLIVTGESVSMISEVAAAATAEHHKFSVEMLDGKLEQHPFSPIVHALDEQDSIIRIFPAWHTSDDPAPPEESRNLIKQIWPLPGF